jgi:membrane associated rhomboid family serine protease
VIPLRDDNPAQIRPIVTYALIGACVVTFLWQLTLGQQGNQRAVLALGAIPAVLFHKTALPPEIELVGPWTSALTSMFLHGGWMHLIGNMLFLWIFGDNVEDSMGHVRFLSFYLLCGIAAVLAQAVPDPNSTVPMIGASGAISGVLGAYLLLFPHARVHVLVALRFVMQRMRLPAIWVLLLWFGIQLISTLASGGKGGGVAFRAHVGGFIAGALLVVIFKHRNVRLWHPPRI